MFICLKSFSNNYTLISLSQRDTEFHIKQRSKSTIYSFLTA